jgi:hypothetical protein
MLGISVENVSYFIEKARNLHSPPESWDEVSSPGLRDSGAQSLYEDQAIEIARQDLEAFIAGLPPCELAELMALMDIGRGKLAPDGITRAISTAEDGNAPHAACQVLMATPLAADFVEMGLERLGLSPLSVP